MKTVTLKHDLRPWRAGDDLHLEDALAEALVAAGDAENLRPFAPMGYEAAIADPVTKPARRGVRK